LYDALKDKMGRYRTLSLFWENRNPDYIAPFTLKDRDHKGRISMYRKYMEYADPTEYEFAIAILGSWKHWKVLCNAEWFKPYVTEWREELKTRMESQRRQEMEQILETSPGTPMAVQATKWLAQRYGEAAPKKRGRPSNHEKSALLKEEAAEEKLLEEDAERLGLV